MDSQPTTFGTPNVTCLWGEKSYWYWLHLKKVWFGFVYWFLVIKWKSTCFVFFRLKYFSYALCPNISVVMILVWIFVFTIFLVQATFLITKMMTMSVLLLMMKQNSSTELCEIWGQHSIVDENWVFGILHHVKGVNSYESCKRACCVHPQGVQSKT